ncbi:hypothetical protein JB92DRAFT_2704006, partial [Gautieria morchelliformis]
MANPPRPHNAWIIYRCAKVEELTQLLRFQTDECHGAVSSLHILPTIVGKMWREETPEVRTECERLSDIEKAEHQIAYAAYRFRPMKKAHK